MALQKDFLSNRITLADGEAGKKTPPAEFRIFAAGLFDTTKGPFLFDVDASASVLRCAADYGNELNCDYNHGQADGWPVDPALAGRSAGWFKLELRNGELWAVDVRWTPTAHAAIAASEWRYVSPWFSYDPETRRIAELHNVALTNTPATKHLKPLTANRLGETSLENPDMDPKLLAALGLSPTATLQDVLSAIATRDAQLTAGTAQKTQVAELLSLTGAADVSAALGVAKAWKASHEALPAVQEKLSTLEKASVTAELKSLLDEAQKAGKVAPSERPSLEEYGKASLSGLKAYLSVKAPVVVTETAKPGNDNPGAVTLSDEDRKVAKQMSIPEAEMLKAKSARATA